MDLKSLIDQPSKLPTVPRVTQRVIASFGSEEVTLGEIAELIGITSGWVLPHSLPLNNADLPRIPALHDLSHGLDEMLK